MVLFILLFTVRASKQQIHLILRNVLVNFIIENKVEKAFDWPFGEMQLVVILKSLFDKTKFIWQKFEQYTPSPVGVTH